MIKGFQEIARLIEKDATHRRGWKLSQATPEIAINHAIQELEELRGDLNNIEELADVFGCLIHYAIMKGWSLENIEVALLIKLSQRFTENG